MDNSEVIDDAYEHLVFSHKAKSRLKSSLNLEKVIRGEAVTFEVDMDDATAELSIQDDDDDDYVAGLDYAASYLSKKTQATLAKNCATIEALANTDFMSTVFSEVEQSMISIHTEDLVKKEIVRAGTGKKVPENGKVFLHYVAVCEGADEPCDSTLLRRTPEILDMRKGSVLPGFFLAVSSMELNEVAKFIVKSPMAFGKHGCAPRIPPNADILYIVEVLQIIDEELLQSPLYMTADERAVLPFKKIMDTSEQLRTDGNGLFQEGRYRPAVKKYRKGVAILEDYPLAGAEEEKTRNQLLHTLYANLAQCFLLLERPAQACTMCKNGLRCASGKDSVKLLYRFAKAKIQLKDFEGAIGLCDKALKFQPSSQEIKNLRQKAQHEEKQAKAESEKMFQGIFKN